MRILAMFALVAMLAVFGCASNVPSGGTANPPPQEKPAQVQPETIVTAEKESDLTNTMSANLTAEDYIVMAANLTSQYGQSMDYYNTTIRAMALVNKSLELDPDNVYAYILRGYIWDYLGNATNARADSEKAYAFEPDNPDVLADMCRTSNDTSVAMRYCNRAVSLNPNVSVYYRLRAFTKGLNRDHQGGIEDINYAIYLDPNSTKNYHFRCVLKTYRRTYISYSKEYRTALSDCQRYLDEYPYRWDVIMDMALTKLMWKNRTESLRDYEKALELILEQENRTGMELRYAKNDVYGEIGSIKVGLKEYSEAVYYMDLAIKYADEEPYQNLTRDSNKTGGMFIGTVMGIPKDSWGAWNHYWRGVAKYRLGDIEGARVDFNRSNELDRRYDDFIEMRGSLESPGLAPYIEIRYYQD